MLDEKEDTGTEYFLGRATENEGEGEESGARGCKGGSKGAVEKGNLFLSASSHRKSETRLTEDKYDNYEDNGT